VAAVSQQLPSGHRLRAAFVLLIEELIPFQQEAIATALRSLALRARSLEIVSLLVIVWGSSGIFVPIEMALNRAWGAAANRSFLRSRALAFLMTLACGALVLGSVGLTLAARGYRREWPTLAFYGVKTSALLLTYMVFFLVYWLVPGRRIGVRVAARAALWGGTAWELVKYLFVARLPAMKLEAVYGPLALAVALILWAFVSSLVLVFGALMTAPEAGRRKAD
jgi:membrane protein